VASKAAAVIRAAIETESDVFVMPSLLLVEPAPWRANVGVRMRGQQNDVRLWPSV